MPKRVPLLVLLIFLGAWVSVKDAASAQSSRPNIVFILADDLGWGDLGSYNPASKIPTPNLDRLAGEGARFTDAHAPGSWCTPSRYGLLTGTYPSRLEELNWQERALIRPGQTTLASLLKESGYATAMIGKWHLGFEGGMDCAQPLRGGPVDHGFDRFFGMHASTDIPPYFYIEGNECVAAPTQWIGANRSDPEIWNEIQGAFWRAGPIAPGLHLENVLPRFREEAVAFLEDHHRDERDQPFFLYLALTAPHTPWLPLFQGVSGAGIYGDFTVQVDDLVGQVAATLERLGYAENTLLTISSDNGPVWYPKDVALFGHRATALFRGMKFDLWEGGHRMPFVARWPGHIPAGSVRDQLISFTDMLPTFAAIVGRQLPAGAAPDGYNILPAMLNEAGDRPIRAAMVHFTEQGKLAIRQGPWKLISGDEGGELYNLADDPDETNNRYGERPQVVKQLTALLAGYRKPVKGSND